MSESIREIVQRFVGVGPDGDHVVADSALIEALEARESAEKARVAEIIHDATAQYAAQASKALEERDEARCHLEAWVRLHELTKDDVKLVDVNFELLGERNEARALAVKCAEKASGILPDAEAFHEYAGFAVGPDRLDIYCTHCDTAIFEIQDAREAIDAIRSKPWGKS